jgi:hypothetical protein
MNLMSYLLVVAFYIFAGFSIYLIMRRILSHFIEMKIKTIKAVSLAVSSVMTLGGVGLSTFAFFYLK